MHLSAQSDTARARRGVEDLVGGLGDRGEPRARIALRPARVHGVDRVGAHGGGQHDTVIVDMGDLDRLGAEVDAEDAHRDILAGSIRHILPR